MKRFLALCLLLLLCLIPPRARAAGAVTDTLTVKVGYFGMETEQYVQVGSYHWSELYNALPLYQNAYSFFRSGTDGDYRTVIDSAYGFYLTDLLDYAGVYSGDVQSIAFYTQDQDVGFFTSFTAADLFYTERYYFNDLAAHIRPVYDEAGNVVAYNADEAWGDCRTVQPMLALEDSWVSYEIGTEHTAPNYASLGTGNRFRLLFGQSYPMECRTNQSAKYTHTLYITLQGAPKVCDELPELDGEIGSHSVTFRVSVGQQALRDALAQFLNISSSDSSVLEITGITVTPDAEFSDLATVTLTYTVHTEGSAELSFLFGGAAMAERTEVRTHDPAPTEPPTEPTEPTEPPTAQPTGDTGNGTNGGEPSPTEPTEAPVGPSGPTQNGRPEPTEPPEPPEPTEEPVRMYALSDALAAQLAGGRQDDAQTGGDGSAAAASHPVTRLTVPQEDDGRLLLLTGAGALALAVLGALSALRYYSNGRKEK